MSFSLLSGFFKQSGQSPQRDTTSRENGGLAAVLAAAIIFVGAQEGLRTDAYRDSVGVPTICYGETLGVKLGQHKTVSECKAMFGPRLEEFWHGMHDPRKDGKYIKVPVSVKTDVALLSFSYNVGLGGFRRSKTLALLNQGKYTEACNALMGWVKPPEVKNRRAREKALCLEGVK
jgi:lysozyme